MSAYLCALLQIFLTYEIIDTMYFRFSSLRPRFYFPVCAHEALRRAKREEKRENESNERWMRVSVFRSSPRIDDDAADRKLLR